MYGTLIKAGLAIAAALLLAWAGIATYDHVYAKGVAAEHANTLTAEAKLKAMEDRAVQAERTAKDNETSALALGKALQDQADVLDEHEARAKSDNDGYAAALDAARAAAAAASCQGVPTEVHSALTGKATPEDAPLPGSLKAALRELKRRGK